MILSKAARPLTASARKDLAWRTTKPVLGTKKSDHGFEQQAQLRGVLENPVFREAWSPLPEWGTGHPLHGRGQPHTRAFR